MTDKKGNEANQEGVRPEEVDLITDGEGLVVLGSVPAVDAFLRAAGLTAAAEQFDAHVARGLRLAGAVAQAGAAAAADSGRWVRLTPESTNLIKTFGLMPTKTPGIKHAMIGRPGAVSSWLQIENGSASSLLDPSALSGLAVAMVQFAQQHEMRRIHDHLDRLDRKIDVVLRAQHNAEAAKVIGAGVDIASALVVRHVNGTIDEVTWSTVQARTQTLSDALGWALLELESVATHLAKSRGRDLERMAADTDNRVRELIAIIARCFELQDALDLLRLDRVSPDDLDGHRLALSRDRVDRRARVTDVVDHLLERIVDATSEINTEVILHPRRVGVALDALDSAREVVQDFEEVLEIPGERVRATRLRWVDALTKVPQLQRAGVEAGRNALIGAVTIGGLVLAVKRYTSGAESHGTQS